MLTTAIIHPELIRGLAEAGHGARILIGDSNYPVTVKSNSRARFVFLNFVPGIVGGVDIVRALARTVPIESALYMSPPDGEMPVIVKEYHALIGKGVPFEGRDRFDFYEEAASEDTALVIASGEQRIYANLLITVGWCILPYETRKRNSDKFCRPCADIRAWPGCITGHGRQTGGRKGVMHAIARHR